MPRKTSEIRRDNNPSLKQSMRQRSTKGKMLGILTKLANHPFAIPFTKNENTTQNSRHTLCGIMEQVRDNRYEDTKEVIKDIVLLLENTQNVKVLKYVKKHLEEDDIDMIASSLKKKFFQLYNKTFNNTEHENHEKAQPIIVNVKIPETPYDVTISINNQGSVTQETSNPNNIKLFKYYPSKSHDFSRENSKHAYIGGYQFHKMMSDLPKNSSPLRKIPNVGDSIETIIYVENKQLKQTYEDQRRSFKHQGKVNEAGTVDELLLFHGTTTSCIQDIIKNNFKVEALPQQLTMSNQPRKKSMIFGKGIYFSPIPALSLLYGNGLLLCKVLPGSVENIIMRQTQPHPFNTAYDSREISTDGKTSLIHMVRHASQILPYCIIQLKKQSLISEFTKPSSGKNIVRNQETQTNVN